MELRFNDQRIELTEEGFLQYQPDWNEAVAEALARLNHIELTPEHWQILFFIRDYYSTYDHLPNSRVFVKALKTSLGEDIGNSRYLHRLFPEGPLKYACKLAGLPKPPTCL